MRTFGSLVILSLCASFSVACSASSPGNDDPGATADALKAKGDDLVVCTDAKGKKGDVRLFRIEKASASESKNWKTKVVAVGLRGTLGGEHVDHSQGDQPDVVALERHGDKIELSILKKTCAGRCENFVTLSSGGGDEEVTHYVGVSRFVIDTHDKELSIEGKRAPSGEATTITFQKCDVNGKLLDEVEASFR